MKSKALWRGKTIDPVCGAALRTEMKVHTFRHGGRVYSFCTEACRKTFERNPDRYLNLKGTSVKPKGIWGRYLDRIQKATGGKPPCCH